MGSNRRTVSAAIATVLVSVALYPVFTGSAWFWAGTGATVTIALAGTLTRLRRLPVAVCLLGGVAGLLLYLNVVFAHSRSLLLAIPTPSSLAYLWHLAGQGINQAAGYAPPAPELAGMVLLATGGIGLTALFTDLIAVRLRSAALAGLPLLLLFTEPFTLSVSRGWLGTTAVFCLAAVGYLTILGGEGRERVREWERPRPGQAERRLAGQVPDTRALTAAGRRVGAAAVIVALCVPMFVPGLHATRLFAGSSPGIGGAGGGTGGAGFPGIQNVVTSELRDSRAVPVLTYTTSARQPGYLQVYVLDNLTAAGWQPFSQPESLVTVAPRLPPAPGLTDTAAASPVTTDITVAKNVPPDALSALAAPYPAITVHAAAGTIRADRDSLMIFDNGARLGGLSYTVTSADVAPGEQALAAAPASVPGTIRAHYLKVPRSYLALRGLAQDITAGARSPYAEAVALQNYFADGNFTYSLSALTFTNESGLATFLYTTRTGYCVQFASAMAVLARLLRIPSRVVYGFTQGKHVSGDEWAVTTQDAHAWPELYFQGFGWLRFEPTPGGPTGQGTAIPPAYTQQRSASPASASASPTPSASVSPGGADARNGQSALSRNKFLALGGQGGQTPVKPAPGGLSPWSLAGLSLLGLLALIVIAPGFARSLIRRRRWRAAGRTGDAGLARAAWLELRDDLTDYGAGYHPSETPRALAARIADTADPDAAAALRRVAMAAERARYSARPVPGTTLRQDSTAVRRSLAASASRWARWRARVFPPSVVAPVAVTLSQATDVFGRLSLSRDSLASRSLARQQPR